MKTAYIKITMPTIGKITISAIGSGKNRIQAVTMLEKATPQIKKLLEKWYLMQLQN